MNPDGVRAGFVAAGMPSELADEVLEQYIETKRRYYLDDHRPTAVEGGRFCEAVTRVLEHALLGMYTPLGKSLASLNDKRLNTFFNAQGKPDGLRVHLEGSLFHLRHSQPARCRAPGRRHRPEHAGRVARRQHPRLDDG